MPTQRRPWEMTRDEFEQTGEDLLHGTSHAFDRFGGEGTWRDRYGNTVSGPRGRRFYFTDHPQVAHQLSDYNGYKRVDFNRWLEAKHGYADEGGGPEDWAHFHDVLNSQIARGYRLAHIDYEPGSQSEGKLVSRARAEDIPEYDYHEGDVRLYHPGRWPRVVPTRVYGTTLDLTKPGSVPDDLWAALGKSRPAPSPYKQNPQDALPFAAGRWNHEHSDALVDYAERNGYGKVRVPDSYESGHHSVMGLTPYIGLGRDPHREFVQQAMQKGESVPEHVLSGYPDLQRDHLDRNVSLSDYPGAPGASSVYNYAERLRALARFAAVFERLRMTGLADEACGALRAAADPQMPLRLRAARVLETTRRFDALLPTLSRYPEL